MNICQPSKLIIKDLHINKPEIRDISFQEMEQVNGGILPALIIIGASLVVDWYIAQAMAP